MISFTITLMGWNSHKYDKIAPCYRLPVHWTWKKFSSSSFTKSTTNQDNSIYIYTCRVNYQIEWAENVEFYKKLCAEEGSFCASFYEK